MTNSVTCPACQHEHPIGTTWCPVLNQDITQLHLPVASLSGQHPSPHAKTGAPRACPTCGMTGTCGVACIQGGTTIPLEEAQPSRSTSPPEALLAKGPRQPSQRRSTLNFRPAWTPALVATPAQLADQIRLHWADAAQEIEDGADPRMLSFIAGIPGMNSAVAILNSSQPTASKMVLLQGLLDPEGPIQFQGVGLDHDSVAEQIQLAKSGEEASLRWLDAVQREHVLTAFAEITGAEAVAEADYRLDAWHVQATALIDSATLDEKELPKRIKKKNKKDSDSWVGAAVNRMVNGWLEKEAREREETRAFLHERVRWSLPWLFTVALSPAASGADLAATLAEEVRALASASSPDPNDYHMNEFMVALQSEHPDRNLLPSDMQRAVLAVRRTLVALEEVGDDDLGTLVAAQAVLADAKSKRDKIRSVRQMMELVEHWGAAEQRQKQARQRADAAQKRAQEGQQHADAARSLERLAHQYGAALKDHSRPITINDTAMEQWQRAHSDRIAQAQVRGDAAAVRLRAAEERERWAREEGALATDPDVNEKLRAEGLAAAEEQTEALEEQQAAKDENQAAEEDLALIAEEHSKYEELMRPVRAENERRRQAQQRSDLEERARREEQDRRKRAEQREREAAADRRQERVNQQQQEVAGIAKRALAADVEELLALPVRASAWRPGARAALAERRRSLEESILKLQNAIRGPLSPPRTKSKVWPPMLSPGDRYLGVVKKIKDYGAFVTLPAGAEGLLRDPIVASQLITGQRIVVEITSTPYNKPIVLKGIESKNRG